MPDTENLLKLSELYGVSVDTILKCGETEEADGKEVLDNTEAKTESEASDKKPETKIIFIEKQEHKKPNPHIKKEDGFSFPIQSGWRPYMPLSALAFSAKGWITGWLVFLTIPLFYTGIIAFEKKKPVLFCYPVLATLVYLILGFLQICGIRCG